VIPRDPLGPHPCNAFALTPELPLSLDPCKPFALVASPRLGLRHTSVIIIRFDPSIVEVGDLVVGVVQSRFFMKIALWIKTKPRIDGR